MSIFTLPRAINYCMITMVCFLSVFLITIDTAQAVPLKISAIESIKVSGDGDATELIIQLSAPATYTSYKTTAPLRLVLDLSQTKQGAITVPQVINKGNFKTITASRFDTDAGVLTRVDIELANDGEPVITATPDKPGEIRIALSNINQSVKMTKVEEADKLQAIEDVKPKQVVLPAQNADDTALLLRSLTAISVKDGGVLFALNKASGNFKLSRYHKPERVAMDISDTRSTIATSVLSLDIFGGLVASVANLPDKVRVVLESGSGKLPEIEAKVLSDGIFLELKDALIAPEKAVSELKLITTQSGTKMKDIPDVAAPVSITSVLSVDNKKTSYSTAVESVEMIDFQVVEGVSRVAIKVNRAAKVDQPVKGNGFVTLTLKNTLLPKHLQRSLETQAFASPVLRITPMLIKSRKGVDTQIRIALRMDADYTFKREGDMLYLDFQHPAAGMIVSVNPLVDTVPSSNFKSESSVVNPAIISGNKKLVGKKVSLDFDNAEIRHIFRLLADVSQKNFIVGDDVKGSMSIKLTNVPWEQALELILDSKSLVMREHGNVVSIMTKDVFKSKAKEEIELQEQKNSAEKVKAEAEKAKSEIVELTTGLYSLNYSDISSVVSQLNNLKSKRGTVTQDARTNKIIVTDVPNVIDRMGKLVKLLDIPEKQVMIEARIVEATSTFTKSLGVNWGIHYRDGSAALFGINQFDSSFGGIASTAAPVSGVSGQSGGAAGISFGTLTSNIQLDLRLNAAASAGLVKIVSTPKVATLNNKTAKITQGQQVPYTSSTSDKVETKFVEAALSLEVTPHINSNGTIGMKIDAKNDSVGQATGGSTAPAINKKQATTEMLLRDGETTVIGGIYVDSDNESDDGVPYLMDIPYLGKVFRSNSKTKVKTELLIFITPRILGDV